MGGLEDIPLVSTPVLKRDMYYKVKILHDDVAYFATLLGRVKSLSVSIKISNRRIMEQEPKNQEIKEAAAEVEETLKKLDEWVADFAFDEKPYRRLVEKLEKLMRFLARDEIAKTKGE